MRTATRQEYAIHATTPGITTSYKQGPYRYRTSYNRETITLYGFTIAEKWQELDRKGKVLTEHYSVATSRDDDLERSADFNQWEHDAMQAEWNEMQTQESAIGYHQERSLQHAA